MPNWCCTNFGDGCRGTTEREVLPKSARFPRFGTIKVVWGEPIHVSVNNTFDRREAADELRNQVMGAIKDLQDLHRKP